MAGMLILGGCSTIGLGRSATAPAGGTPPPAGPPAASTIISEMRGGLVGGEIGKGLNSHERRLALEAEYKTLEYTPGGQTVTWQGDRPGRRGEVMAAQPYRVGSQDCRQYSHTVHDGSMTRNARGTACRNPDGSWTPLN